MQGTAARMRARMTVPTAIARKLLFVTTAKIGRRIRLPALSQCAWLPFQRSFEGRLGRLV